MLPSGHAQPDAAIGRASMDVLATKLYCVSAFAGSYVAAGGEPLDISVSRPGSGSPALQLSGHTAHVNAIAAVKEPDADAVWSLLSASADGRVCQWHVSTAATNTLVRGSTFSGHEGPVRSVCWVHSAHVLASAGGHDDMTVRIWDVRQVRTKPPARRLSLVSFMGRKGGGDPACTAIMRGHTAPVECIERVSETVLASASLDETVRLWDTSRHAEHAVLRGHRREVLCVRAAGEALLISSSDDRTVKCWDVRTQKSVQSWGGAHSGSIYCCLPGPFGQAQLVLSGGADGKLVGYDTRRPGVTGRGGVLFSLAGAHGLRAVNGLSADSAGSGGSGGLAHGRAVWSCGDDGMARSWLLRPSGDGIDEVVAAAAVAAAGAGTAAPAVEA